MTLHGKGAVVSTTGGNADQLNSMLPIVPRENRKKVQDIIKGKGIPVLQYESEISGLSKLKL